MTGRRTHPGSAHRRRDGLRLLVAVAVAASLVAVSPPARGQSAAACDDVDGLTAPQGSDGLRAVLFVHGWTGSADDWTAPIAYTVDEDTAGLDRSLVDQIARFDATDPWLLDYHDTSARWVDDDGAGGPRVAAAVDCLFDHYGVPVGVAAHSMGGLATRWAAARDGRADRIAAVATFGTPHTGSDSAALLAAALGLSDDGALADRVAWPHIILLRACGLLTDIDADWCWPLPAFVAAFDSSAGQGLRTGSDQLAALPDWPDGLPTMSVAGDVELVTQASGAGLFYQDLVSASIGDGPVSLASATATGTETWNATCRHNIKTGYAVSDDLRQLFGVHHDDNTERSLLGLRDTPCWHGRLMRTVEITTRAVGFLHEHVAELTRPALGVHRWATFDLMQDPLVGGTDDFLTMVHPTSAGIVGSTLGRGVMASPDGVSWTSLSPRGRLLDVVDGPPLAVVDDRIVRVDGTGTVPVAPLPPDADPEADWQDPLEAGLLQDGRLTVTGHAGPDGAVWTFTEGQWERWDLRGRDPDLDIGPGPVWAGPDGPVVAMTETAGDWSQPTLLTRAGRVDGAPGVDNGWVVDVVRRPDGRLHVLLGEYLWPLGLVDHVLATFDGTAWTTEPVALPGVDWDGDRTRANVAGMGLVGGDLALVGRLEDHACPGGPDTGEACELESQVAAVWSQDRGGWAATRLEQATRDGVALRDVVAAPDGTPVLVGAAASGGEHFWTVVYRPG